ncbi:MAG: hypothetical protein ACKPGI_02310, partial [Verrucomicrobiota bacterium]
MTFSSPQSSRLRRFGILPVLTWAGWMGWAGQDGATNPAQTFLRYDNLGNLVATPKDEVPSILLPTDAASLRYQVPRQAPGTTRPKALEERLEAQREGADVFTWFPR